MNKYSIEYIENVYIEKKNNNFIIKTRSKQKEITFVSSQCFH